MSRTHESYSFYRIVTLFRFAIDGSLPVMVPLDSSVTVTGNTVLSDLDVAKINCAYMCEGQGGPCGGTIQVRDQPVELPGSGSADCRWAVSAYGDQEDDDHQQFGLQIRILEVLLTFSSSSRSGSMLQLPDCSDGSVDIYDVDENGDIWALCGEELPVLRTSARTAIIDSNSDTFRAEITRYESVFHLFCLIKLC